VVTGLMSVDFYGYRQSGLEIGWVQTCVFGCGLLLVGRQFVSGNCVREARELIPWTMKTFDHRG
jgi:hypothetical protein